MKKKKKKNEKKKSGGTRSAVGEREDAEKKKKKNLYILGWQMIATAHPMYHRWHPVDVGNPIVVNQIQV